MPTGYVNFISGFNIESNVAIDSRLVLTHQQMIDEKFVSGDTKTTFLLPDAYLCMCSDDHKLYLYDSSLDPVTTITDGDEASQYGKFKLFDAQISYDTTEAKTNLNTAVAETTVVSTLTADEDTPGSVKYIVKNATADGSEIEEVTE